MNQPEKMRNTPTVIIVDEAASIQNCPELQNTSSLSWLMAGKPMIRHILEELQPLGVQNCFILSSGHAIQISQIIEEELHFSNHMRIEVLDYNVNAKAALKLFSPLAEDSGLLLIETNAFTECCVASFLEKCGEMADILISAEQQTESIGLTFLRKNGAINLSSARKIEMPVQQFQLQSTWSYIQSNISILDGNMPGRLASLATNNCGQHWQHNRSFISHKTKLQNSSFIDRGSYISAGCELNNVVVHKDCVVEKNVILNNIVLLPGTWVTRHQTLENSLISQENIYPT